jgi:hypothetical protein
MFVCECVLIVCYGWYLKILMAVAAHMYASLRIIYSWPMDSASPVDVSYLYVDSATTVEKDTVAFMYADKFPAYRPYTLTLQPWMSAAQRQIFPIYQQATLVVLALTLFVCVIIPVAAYVRRMLTKIVSFEGKEMSDIPYSAVARIPAYVPVAGEIASRSIVLNAYVAGVDIDHLPVPGKEFEDVCGGNLANCVPSKYISYVMNVVKQYPVGKQDMRVTYSGTAQGNAHGDIERGNTNDSSSTTTTSSGSGMEMATINRPKASTASNRPGGFAVDNELLRLISGPPAHVSRKHNRVQDSENPDDNSKQQSNRKSFRSDRSMRNKYASIKPEDIIDVNMDMDAPPRLDAPTPAVSATDVIGSTTAEAHNAENTDTGSSPAPTDMDNKDILVDIKAITGQTSAISSAAAEIDQLSEFSSEEKRLLRQVCATIENFELESRDWLFICLQLRRSYIRKSNSRSSKSVHNPVGIDDAEESKDPSRSSDFSEPFLTFPTFYAYVKSKNEALLAELDQTANADIAANKPSTQSQSKRVLRLIFINVVAIQMHLLSKFKASMDKPSPTTRQDRATYETLNKAMLETRVDRGLWDNYIDSCDWKLTGVNH